MKIEWQRRDLERQILTEASRGQTLMNPVEMYVILLSLRVTSRQILELILELFMVLVTNPQADSRWINPRGIAVDIDDRPHKLSKSYQYRSILSAVGRLLRLGHSIYRNQSVVLGPTP